MRVSDFAIIKEALRTAQWSPEMDAEIRGGAVAALSRVETREKELETELAEWKHKAESWREIEADTLARLGVSEARITELEAELTVLREGMERQKRGADNAAFHAEAAEADNARLRGALRDIKYWSYPGDAVDLIQDYAAAALADMTAQRDDALASNAVFMSAEAYSRMHDAWHAEMDRAEAAEAEAVRLREALASARSDVCHNKITEAMIRIDRALKAGS